MEGEKHFPKILSLINTEHPDVICLQECPESFQTNIQALGYTTNFLAMCFDIQNDVAYCEGLLFASKLPFHAIHKYYYQPDRTLPTQPVPTIKSQQHHGYIFGSIECAGELYNIATTHVMVTPDGMPTEHQAQGVKKLLSQVASEKPHIICGDFNIPRGINPLYEDLTKIYADAIPLEYASSLDRNIHRLGKNQNLNAPIFDTYMVDYLFAKPEYTILDVRLQFGVSDHAAVVGNIKMTL